MSERFICVHGHFYQPPRENPWLETIEVQDSAHPFHDWNARIATECYGANAASRVLDDRGRVEEIVNNYSRISFNFGPTLLSWLEAHEPDIYEAILRADRASMERFGGHGAAMAQVFNHAIMPLSNTRDRRTQIWWGLRDFEHRFGRKPEGMWLAETAADLETLSLLAEYGIRYTVLAPNQAARVRLIESDSRWQEVGPDRIDPTRAYLQRLPCGRTITLFFYDGPISRAIAFEGLLERGESLANRLVGAFSERASHAQLVHIATDGETYGHHHKHGEMALSYALRHIEEEHLATLTVYGHYLDLHPPEFEVQLEEMTSWSCAHGVERWRSDCGCHTGGGPGWNQAWRGPLREALDHLRDAIAPEFERVGGELLNDPWHARDDYIHVLLDHSEARIDAFLTRHRRRLLDEEETVRALELLEMQRHAMLMYTSCGWFFNDVSGIETVQILQYAARVIQLAERALGAALEDEFLRILSNAKSNVASQQDARSIYEREVRPTILTLEDVCAHHAIASLFEVGRGESSTPSYAVTRISRSVHEAGRARMAMGRARITSRLTRRSEVFDYGVLHLGDHNVDGGVRAVREDDPELVASMHEAVDAFSRGEFPTLIRLLDRQFGQDKVFSLRSLFRDEQRRVLDHVMGGAMREASASFRAFYERRAPLLAFLANLETPIPKHLAAIAQMALEDELTALLVREDPPHEEIFGLLSEVENLGIAIDWSLLEVTAMERLDVALSTWREDLDDPVSASRMLDALRLFGDLPVEVSFWRVQNTVFQVIEERWQARMADARRGEEGAKKWILAVEKLGALLSLSPAAWPGYKGA